MRRLDFSNPDNRSEQDLQRIMRVGLENGYQVSPQQAYALWDSYSDSCAAGWLFVEDDDEILRAVERWYDM